MKLIEKIKDNTLVFPINSEGKSTTMQELLNHLLSEGYLTATTKLFSFMNNQDKMIGSAVGRGVAFHHSSSVEIDEMIAVLGITKFGIDYQSPDRQKVHFVLLILDPTNEPNTHRKFIHRFQKFINECDMKTKILDCKSKDEVLELINNWEEKYLLNESIE
jgi:mannitol/fructose-specific phosphotransferase system IIA component (Ntr-type)